MNNKFNIQLGDTMRRMREAKGLNTVQVAERMHVSKVTVHYWETGKRQINASSLKEYCAVINVKIQQIFDEMDEVKQ